MNILAIVPARAGSKGIENKNIYPIAGKPLIEWTIGAMLDSNLKKSLCILSTDSVEYGNIGCMGKLNYQYMLRPKYLSTDNAKAIDVIKHCVKCFEYVDTMLDAVMLLQPTSPLRTAEDIDNAIKLFEDSGANSLYSGYYMGIKHKDKVYDKHTSERHFQRNGAIFIAKRELIKQGKLWDDTAVEFEMPLSRSIDIDTMDDMRIAEALLQYRAQGGQI